MHRRAHGPLHEAQLAEARRKVERRAAEHVALAAAVVDGGAQLGRLLLVGPLGARLLTRQLRRQVRVPGEVREGGAGVRGA